MRADEFIVEQIGAESDENLIAIAQKYLTQMFKKGIAHRSAVLSVMDTLKTRGVEYNRAAQIAKKAFSILNGNDVTTE